MNDFAAGTNFAGITIAATAASMTLNGNSINLAGDVAMNRTTASTISTPFVLQQNVAIDVPADPAAVLTLGGVISGGFKVTKTGVGFAAYNVAMTYGGGTEISGGALRQGSDANTNTTIGSGAVTLSNGGTLELRGTGAATFNNDLVLGTGGGSIAFRGSDFFQPPTLTGTGPLTITGIGNTTVTPIDFKGWNGQINGVIAAGSTLTIRLDNAYVGNSALNAAIDLGAGVSLTKRNGTNSTAVIDIGKLSGAVSSSLGQSAAGSGTFIYSIGARNEDSTFSGNVVDGGTKTAIQKVGNNTLTLAGTANTFSGASEVNAGRLNLDGVYSAATLTITANSGGTLGGNGTIAGTVTVADGGTLAPGTSVGTLTVNNNVLLNPMSTLAFELTGTDTSVGGTANDLLTGLTNLTLDGTLNVTETAANSFMSAIAGNQWRLIDYSGTLTDNGLELGTMPALQSGLGFQISAAAGQINLLVVSTAIPEPGAFLFGGLVCVMMGAVYTIRRRRQPALAIVRE